MPNNINVYINPKLLPFLTEHSRFKVAYGGRGSSKSWGVARILIAKAHTERGIKILCTKGTQASIADSVYQLIREQISLLGLEDYFECTKTDIRHIYTGSVFLFKGLQHPARIKSIENIKYAWVEEASVDFSEEAYEILIPTIRAEGSEIYFTFNPFRETDVVYGKFVHHSHPQALTVKLNYQDNPFFPDVLEQDMEYDRRTNYLKYLHVWEGELEQAPEGALWTDALLSYVPSEDREILAENEYEDLERIVVALDPSGTSTDRSDACGIVVAGKYRDEDRYIVLEDATAIMSPHTWGQAAVNLYNRYTADRIVAEQNFGGDMVQTIIRSIQPHTSYKKVTASRGKLLRAEPIAALYEAGKVQHLRHFVDLEYEMKTYTGDSKQKSPNRLDALVWALTDLSSTRQRKGPAGMKKAAWF